VVVRYLRRGMSRSCGCILIDAHDWPPPPEVPLFLEGATFGRWTVLEERLRPSADVPVLCECGNKRWVKGTSLLRGESKSCGCRGQGRTPVPRHFEPGMRYGKWTVTAAAEGRAARVPCRCDCGTERDVLGASLLQGQSRSCGCGQREARGGNQHP
jgi:hypothetical protein